MIWLIERADTSLTMSGSTKKLTGISTVSPGAERLLGEAEALDLVEVGTGSFGRDVEARGTGHRFIDWCWSRGRRRALFSPSLTSTVAWTGLNFQVRPPRDVGIEAHQDRTIEDLAFVRRLFGALRRAGKAGHLAEHLVKRHGGVGHAQHDDRNEARIRRRAHCRHRTWAFHEAFVARFA